jgi:hypothetical protein
MRYDSVIMREATPLPICPLPNKRKRFGGGSGGMGLSCRSYLVALSYKKLR